MSDNSAGKNQESKKHAAFRREFILEQVRLHKSVTREQIEKGGKWSARPACLDGDVQYFAKNNLPVYWDKTRFVEHTEPRQAPYSVRKNQQEAEKAAIAQLAADFIRGASERHAKMQNHVVYTRDDIIEMIKGGSENEPHPKITETINKLEAIYEKYERLCCLDSGTTTLKVAQLFEKQWHGISSLFDESSKMRSLTVLTNSNEIAEHLSDLNIQVNVMMLGGRLRKETQAFVALAKSCLEAWNIYLDISMVGCVGPLRSNVSGKDGIHHIVGLMSDSLDEEQVKRSIFSRSQIRAVLIDSTKLFGSKKGAAGHYIFATIHPDDVDVIITDSDHGIGEDIEGCRRKGVAVLVAKPDAKPLIQSGEKTVK